MHSNTTTSNSTLTIVEDTVYIEDSKSDSLSSVSGETKQSDIQYRESNEQISKDSEVSSSTSSSSNSEEESLKDRSTTVPTIEDERSSDSSISISSSDMK